MVYVSITGPSQRWHFSRIRSFDRLHPTQPTHDGTIRYSQSTRLLGGQSSVVCHSEDDPWAQCRPPSRHPWAPIDDFVLWLEDLRHECGWMLEVRNGICGRLNFPGLHLSYMETEFIVLERGRLPGKSTTGFGTEILSRCTPNSYLRLFLPHGG